jgi:ATP-dependent Clp protease ATP-binding subunit ClpA
MPIFSNSLEQSLHRAVVLANEGRCKYATLEHLLLALIDDQHAAAAMRVCNVEVEKFAAGHDALEVTRYMSHGIVRSGFASPRRR